MRMPHVRVLSLAVMATVVGSATAAAEGSDADAIRIATARLLLQSQDGEIRLQSNLWDGNSVVIALPYCGPHDVDVL